MYNLAGIEVRVGKKSMCLAAAKAVAVAAAYSCLRVGYLGIMTKILNITARWYGELPSVSRCKVFAGPDRWEKVVMSRLNFLSLAAKTLQHERQPAGLLTLSR